MTTRRRVMQLLPAAAALLAVRSVSAQAPLLDEKDPQAVALGYVADAAKVDKTKFPKFAADQICGNCQLYTGPAAAAAGPCALFVGKSVAAKGWCSAYVKKA